MSLHEARAIGWVKTAFGRDDARICRDPHDGLRCRLIFQSGCQNWAFGDPIDRWSNGTYSESNGSQKRIAIDRLIAADDRSLLGTPRTHGHCLVGSSAIMLAALSGGPAASWRCDGRCGNAGCPACHLSGGLLLATGFSTPTAQLLLALRLTLD
jgi:hypothetical protein